MVFQDEVNARLKVVAEFYGPFYVDFANLRVAVRGSEDSGHADALVRHPLHHRGPITEVDVAQALLEVERILAPLVSGGGREVQNLAATTCRVELLKLGPDDLDVVGVDGLRLPT